MTEIDIKTERLVKLIAGEDLAGLLLNSQHNFAWITCGGNNGVDRSRENGVANILIDRQGKRYILANNIELERILSEQIVDADITPIEYSWQDEKTPGFLLDKAKQIVNGRVATDIGIDASAPAVDGKIATCRYELTAEEKDRYRRLGNNAAVAMDDVLDRIGPGETEIEIARKLNIEFASKDIATVVTLVAADERISQFRHPVPTSNVWKRQLMLVACAKRGGLIVNLTRMVCDGAIPDDLRSKTDATAYVNARLQASTRRGALAKDLYSIAANAYAEKGFADEINKHHQGGATGYRTRDWVAHPYSEDWVRQDQAFAWNPSITGTKVEETSILTDSDIEVITTSQRFPQIVVEIDGKAYSSPDVLSI